MIKGGLKRNGQDITKSAGRVRKSQVSTLIARQLVNGAFKAFTNLGPGHGPSVSPGVVQSHRAQGGQHKQAGAGAGGLGFDEISKSKRKKKGDKTP